MRTGRQRSGAVGALVISLTVSAFAARASVDHAPPTPRAFSHAEPTLEETLIAREKQSWDAWQKRDRTFFEEFLSDDHVEVGFGGRATKAGVVASVGSPTCVVKSYSVDRFELTQLGPDTALLTYHAAQDTSCGNAPVPSPVWVSSLYVRRDGRWQNAAYQQTQTGG